MERSLAEIKSRGHRYWKVEQWNQWSKRRVDLFNIIDVLVLDQSILGVQVCGSDFQDHVRKITQDERENAVAWLESGGRLQIWAWRKIKVKRGGKAMKWDLKIADVILLKNEIFVEIQ